MTDEPDGVIVISANDAFEDQLRRLDDDLRQDVPGAEGYGSGIRSTSTRRPSARISTRLRTWLLSMCQVAEYIGLARVSTTRGRPRLGLIAVLPAYRGRGLASLLLARAFKASGT